MTVWEENENIFEVFVFLGKKENGFLELFEKNENLRKRMHNLPIFYSLEKQFINI